MRQSRTVITNIMLITGSMLSDIIIVYQRWNGGENSFKTTADVLTIETVVSAEVESFNISAERVHIAS